MRLLLLLMLVVGCGGGQLNVQDDRGKACSVTRVDGEVVVECPDGSTEVIERGEDGRSTLLTSIRVKKGLKDCEADSGVIFSYGLDTNADLVLNASEIQKMMFNCDGVAGADGVDGQAGSDGQTGATGETGAAGADGVAGVDGADGVNGVDGQDGVDGQAGVDGAPGQDGADGQDAQLPEFVIVEVIDPCGDAPGIFDEVLLRMKNGQLLAHFASNQLQFITVLVPGNYVTTDGSSCHFSVDAQMEITQTE